MDKFDSILCYSGGLDSYIAWHFLKRPPTVFFDTHTRYSIKERSLVSLVVPRTIIDSSLDLNAREQVNSHIPFRNLLFAAQAAHYSSRIIIAGLADDVMTDKNRSVFLRFSLLLSNLEEKKIVVDSPFWKMTKSEIVRWFLYEYRNGKFSDLDELWFNTTSCYHPEKHFCGECASCFRKWCAIATFTGPPERFTNISMMNEYLEKAKKNIYHPKRNESIIKVVTQYLK